MHPWTLKVISALEPLKNEENATAMRSYLRDQYEFYGIQSATRREAVKTLFTQDALPRLEAVGEIVDELWRLPQREFQLVAIDLLIKKKKNLPATFLDQLEMVITTKSWWDTVDMLATHIAAALYLNYPSETTGRIGMWRKSNNIWLRRTAILYQLKFKSYTQQDVLFETICENLDNQAFFIQKAIGWSLREYSKTDAKAVVTFIQTENIQGLARREGLKWLVKQGYLA